MKKAGWVIIILVVLMAGFMAFNQYIYHTKQASDTTMMNEDINIIPIEHASLILEWQGSVIYADPVGENTLYAGKDAPDLILLTDIHGDHLDVDTLNSLVNENTTIIAPEAVVEKLPENLKVITKTLSNGEAMNYARFDIAAVPMYNYPESDDAFHTKGRGNGYVLQSAGKRVYIAGDTGPTPELKAMQNIDVAFIPMNLPYTMSVEDAAEAVLSFKPKQVIPYHYRTPDGYSDVEKFKELVNQGDPNIDVELLNWYPNK